MADLTPEERERIYLEEKARLEARSELQAKKGGCGNIALVVILCIVGLFVVVMIIGNMEEQREHAEWQKLTPEERHQKTMKNCANFLLSIAYKTYSELSTSERKIKDACELQLELPKEDIIKDR